MSSLGAGDLRERVTFAKRSVADDGYGTATAGGEFQPQFTVWAHLRPLRGTEAVMASRLQGRQPFILSVRQSSQTLQVDESWQVTDARRPERVFAITAPSTDPDGRRAWLEFLVTEGGLS